MSTFDVGLHLAAGSLSRKFHYNRKQMIPFLQAVADAVASRYADLSEVLFLFPNKRAGTFFLKELAGALKHKRGVVAPEVMPIADFVEKMSGKVIADRLTLIFTLYEAYRALTSRKENEEQHTEFEKFVGWGETVIKDFNEVDLYLANPEEIFRNVKDFREISTNFLTDEQMEVMREYFGREEPMVKVDEFWKTFHEPEESSHLKSRFIYLWQMLSPLYREFNERLSSKGLTSVGGAYKLTLSSLRKQSSGELPWKKVVAVGFNALSTVEVAIFKALKAMDGYKGFDDYIDFFWDATGPVLNSKESSASQFVAANRRIFPQPRWADAQMKKSDTSQMPGEMSVIAAPSNSVQAKIVGNIVSDLRSQLPNSDFRDAKVAVVLPDEGLLLPLLYSIPDKIGEINLTMGYSLRLTAVVPLMNQFRRLFLSSRRKGEETLYFHKDLIKVMSNPLVIPYIGEQASAEIVKFITETHRYMVPLEEVRAISARAAELIEPLPEGGLAIIWRLDQLLSRLQQSLKERSDEMLIKQRLEDDHIQTYRDALSRLADLLGESDVALTPRGVFMLVDRLLAATKVNLEGEPLKGLQVMGVLETRALDFNIIIIPSMNERIMPLRARTRTFIPDTLRRGYGLPPSNYAESLFSYYFYRMISRAKEVYLLYDSRQGGGLRSGDVSRYIMQLRYLYARDLIKEARYGFNLKKEPVEVIEIDKKAPKVRALLEEFLVGDDHNKNISASSLNHYMECQLKFFYRTVMGLPDDPEPSDFIDPITQGNIIHSVMEKVYIADPAKRKVMLTTPVRVTGEMIERILADKGSLERMMTEAVNEHHYKREGAELQKPLEGAVKIVAENFLKLVERILRYDKSLAPIDLYGVEITERMELPLPDGRRVNVKFAIDRLDEITDKKTGERRLRIIDYKTGSVNLECEDVESITEDGRPSEQIFQLFFYSSLLGRMSGSYPRGSVKVYPEIYDIMKLTEGKASLPEFKSEKEEKKGEKGKVKSEAKKPARSYGDYSERFEQQLENLVGRVFDVGQPFQSTRDLRKCEKCRYSSICGR